VFQELAAFYRGHASLYHHTSVVPASAVTGAPATAAVSVADQVATAAHPARRIVHLVNHDYVVGVGLQPASGVTITIDPGRPPTTVTLSSPDFADQTTVAPPAGSAVVVRLPAFTAYAVVSLTY
jgi:hypothetical protein